MNDSESQKRAQATNYWQGERVCLRAVEASDAEAFHRWDLDSERGRHLDFLWPPTSLASTQAWVQEASQKKLDGGTYMWVITDRAGIAVGSIDTHHCDARSGAFSYAIAIAAEERGKGYASEAIRMVLRYFFHELRYQKCTISVHSDNIPSIRLHEALGFQREGTLRRMIYTHGRYCDEIWFGMTREEFDEREQRLAR